MIVQLPSDAALDAILGAHPWPRLLGPLARPADEHVVSYVFEYDYRMKGDPATRT